MGGIAGATLAILAVVALAGLLYQWTGSRRSRRLVPPPGRLVEVAPDCRLHLHCDGTGAPAVVFDAGLAASSISWSLVQPRVAELTRACSYDRAGLAWSDPVRGPKTAAGFADQLRTLLDAARVPPPYVLVGHSFGTFVVRAFADRHRDRVAGLVLVDPVDPAEWLAPDAADRRRIAGGILLSRTGALLARVGFVRLCLDLLTRGATGVPRRVSRLFGSEAASLMSRMVGEVQKLPPAVRPAVRAHWSEPKSFVSMAWHLQALRASAVEISRCAPSLGSLPLVVITAASSPPARREAHARLAACSTRGRRVEAASAGHWIHLDDAALVAEAVRAVVEQARSGAR